MNKIHVFAIKHGFYVKIEKLQTAIVWRLPRWVIKWATVRLFANATTGNLQYVPVDQVTYSEAMNKWERKEGGDRSNGTK